MAIILYQGINQNLFINISCVLLNTNSAVNLKLTAPTGPAGVHEITRTRYLKLKNTKFDILNLISIKGLYIKKLTLSTPTK